MVSLGPRELKKIAKEIFFCITLSSPIRNCASSPTTSKLEIEKVPKITGNIINANFGLKTLHLKKVSRIDHFGNTIQIWISEQSRVKTVEFRYFASNRNHEEISRARAD